MSAGQPRACATSLPDGVAWGVRLEQHGRLGVELHGELGTPPARRSLRVQAATLPTPNAGRRRDVADERGASGRASRSESRRTPRPGRTRRRGDSRRATSLRAGRPGRPGPRRGARPSAGRPSRAAYATALSQALARIRHDVLHRISDTTEKAATSAEADDVHSVPGDVLRSASHSQASETSYRSGLPSSRINGSALHSRRVRRAAAKGGRDEVAEPRAFVRGHRPYALSPEPEVSAERTRGEAREIPVPHGVTSTGTKMPSFPVRHRAEPKSRARALQDQASGSSPVVDSIGPQDVQRRRLTPSFERSAVAVRLRRSWALTPRRAAAISSFASSLLRSGG